MPELPEVEVARRAVEEHCLGKKIKKAAIANDSKVIDGVSPSDFEAALLGKTAWRVLYILRVLQLQNARVDSASTVLRILDRSRGIVCSIRLGKVSVAWMVSTVEVMIQEEGMKDFTGTSKKLGHRRGLRCNKHGCYVEVLKEHLATSSSTRGTSGNFSSTLMKGKLTGMAALGYARIHPLQIADSLSKKNCANLDKCIKEVIEKAIEVGADSSQFPKNWIFHSREKKPKAFVDGKEIDFIIAGGRTTAYVPELQKLSESQAAPVGEPEKRTLKGKSSGNDDNDDEIDEPVNKEEKIIESDELKKGSNTGGQGQQPPMKRKGKFEDSIDDNIGGGGAAANGDNDEVQNNKMGKATTNERAKA
ncbi:hypothetical protein FH972_001945 [Carpinus fangiana]|uniref:DNA-formamidopyrimidine glycosylase n=1 Tax=Carpinus fangiana TaxID=176857 RepID=A0A5N6QF68_9ROSI|nr:hypothetical protein FH972_001945 [Carpinus fangiana]